MTQTAQVPLTPWQPVKESTWTRLQAKRAFEIVLGKMLQPENKNLNDELVPYLRALNVQWEKLDLENVGRMWATPQEIESLQLQQGDLLVCEGGEVGRAARIDVELPENTIIQNALHRVRGSELGDVGYLSYCLRHAADAGWFDVICNRATIAHFTVEKFRHLWLSLPPLPTQRRIADYLDRETAQIDELIEAKEQMLKLLQEKRAAQISQMVTKGLDPTVEMKDSGLEWLGEIPAHWGLLRIKTVAHVGNGSTPNRENADYWEGGTFPWLNSSVVNQEIVEDAPRFVTKLALAECHLPVVKPPAVLIGITGQGKTRGKSSVLNFEATINQHLAYIKAKDERLDAFYLSHLLESAYEYLRSESEGTGSTKGAITCEQIAEFRISLPPLNEQQVIVATIRVTQQQYSGIEEDLTKSLSLLRERRSALITAAVTGQLSEVLE